MDEIVAKNLEELETLKSKRRKILEEARKESETMLKDVNKKIEKTIREIREHKADKDKTKESRKEIQEFKEEFTKSASDENDEIGKKYEHLKKKQEERAARKLEEKDIEEPQKLEFVKIDEGKINIGSKVKIKGQDVVGEVTDLGNKNAVVCYGNMYTSITIGRLEKVNETDYKKQNKSAPGLHFNYSEKVINFKPYTDVRGERVDEALRQITELVDEAIMLDFKELKILHGKGNGILRQHIRDYLRKIKQIESCYDEDIRFGGGGITIVKLK